MKFVMCFDLHTLSTVFEIRGSSTTAKEAVATCNAAYNKANWNAAFFGFELGQELPKRAHDLFGWYLFDWRGKYNSDRLFFDGKQPLTQELARTTGVNAVRNWYYAGFDIGGPAEYQFDSVQFGLALLDSLQSAGLMSVPISEFIGSFWYQVKTVNNGDRVGFRIDNDTTLSSGTHIALRHEVKDSVEDLIAQDRSLENMPIDELISKHPSLISILSNRARGDPGENGGGNLYQTYTWTEKRACDWWARLFGDLDIQVWDNYESMTTDPKNWPAR